MKTVLLDPLRGHEWPSGIFRLYFWELLLELWVLYRIYVFIANILFQFAAYLFILLMVSFDDTYYPLKNINLFSNIIFKIKLSCFVPKKLKYWSQQVSHIIIFLFYFSGPKLSISVPPSLCFPPVNGDVHFIVLVYVISPYRPAFFSYI